MSHVYVHSNCFDGDDDDDDDDKNDDDDCVQGLSTSMYTTTTKHFVHTEFEHSYTAACKFVSDINLK